MAAVLEVLGSTFLCKTIVNEVLHARVNVLKANQVIAGELIKGTSDCKNVVEDYAYYMYIVLWAFLPWVR